MPDEPRIVVEIQHREQGITHEVKTDLSLDDAILHIHGDDLHLTVGVLSIRVSRSGIQRLVERASLPCAQLAASRSRTRDLN